jgi:hypothetical protein
MQKGIRKLSSKEKEERKVKINYESLQKFVSEHGKVSCYASPGLITMLKNGEVDAHDLIERNEATIFVFKGKKYRRRAFERLLDDRAE